MSFGMKGVVQKLNGSQNAHTEHYFGLELNKAHIIQRAHQTQAVIWACEPTNDVTDTSTPALFHVDRGDWGGSVEYSFDAVWDCPTDNDPNVPNQIIKHSKLKGEY